MSALSVATVSTGSPQATLSPTFFFHSTMTPLLIRLVMRGKVSSSFGRSSSSPFFSAFGRLAWAVPPASHVSLFTCLMHSPAAAALLARRECPHATPGTPGGQTWKAAALGGSPGARAGPWARESCSSYRVP
eukprot:CAMPEP_0206247306 /NCGR_PEP_ID=MMETSP0047_2-20121206/19739_1 /ASSEMBLY_ACC=CAM_ASM_000192 /TAXON_ID=195065 /ORGANISM="Chroomonas mesostigmatica_cf, Strain CCMP1168" /LENGTH=131 /DNA_ID=CAMNT_0053672821 /DNA_START=81 /DNA_END=477 /DNA_ORIENTATION=-